MDQGSYRDKFKIEDKFRIDDNYLVLQPDKVSAWQIIKLLLWSRKMETKAFVRVPPDMKKELLDDGLAAASLLAQKPLLHFVEKFKSFGEMLEMWLNLVSCNSNIFKFILNILQCKMNVPDRKSDAFMSFIGHLDSRVELDKNIKPGNPRYNSALAAMAAKLAYESKGFIKKTVEQHWKMDFIDMDYNFWNDYQKKPNTQGFLFHDHSANKIVVAFRGTEPFNLEDWSTDVDISCFSNKELGRVHGGFMKALGLVMKEGWPPKLPDPNEGENPKNLAYYSIRDELRNRLEAEENKETKFIVTGHSLGGALAILFPAILALHEEDKLLRRLEGVYTFGQPRVGDFTLKKFMENQFKKYGIKYLRFAYCNDVVTRVPPTDDLTSHPLYTHFGTCLYFNCFYTGQILEDVPHKNYFPIFGHIRRFLNALMELLRSLFLPLLKGWDYREGLAQILFVRFSALLFPSIADHNPGDYVNATRLGSIAAFEAVESSDSASKKTDLN